MVKINNWLSTGIHYENGIDLVSVTNSKSDLPKFVNNNNRLLDDFNGNDMKQDKLDYYHGSTINIYLVYALENIKVDSPDFTAQNCLFGAVKITKDVNTSH